MRQQQTYALPALAQDADTLTKHFFAQFMHEFQSQRTQDTHFRIYTAIEQTAAKTGNAPEVVARALVENGLRATKESFPGKFVSTIENSRVTPRWNLSSVTPQQRELLAFWGSANVNGYKPARRYH